MMTVNSVCWALAGPANQAMLIDVSTPEQRKLMYSIMYWANNLSIAIGGMIGAFLFQDYLFELFVVLSIVAAFVVFLVFEGEKCMIDKNSPIPIYHQLEASIKQLIDNGKLKPGDALPSEREYSDRYGVSRMTVRQAIINLVNDRYLYRIKGKGTFVTEQKFEQNLQRLTSFSEDMKARGMKASSKLINFEIIPADRKLANQLDIPEYGPVYEIKRIRLAEDVPMALERTYISANLAQGLTAKIVQDSLYKYVEDILKLKIANGRQEIEASIAKSEEAQLLEIPELSPILIIQQISKLEDNKVFEVVKSSYRADRYKFMIDLKRM